MPCRLGATAALLWWAPWSRRSSTSGSVSKLPTAATRAPCSPAAANFGAPRNTSPTARTSAVASRRRVGASAGTPPIAAHTEWMAPSPSAEGSATSGSRTGR
eukprot:3941764-Alexandrium_andersonii.AAC.1